MAGLIDDVLDFARSRLGGGLAARVERVENLGPALREVVEELRLANPERVFEEVVGDLGAVMCDPGRIQQLLSNLVGNAVAHGASGRPIEVEASIEEGFLVVAVSNFGQPIPADHLGKLFEPYWRLADSAPGGGLGLGLYICAQIAKAHGGLMQVSSSAEAGTRFAARLPIGGPGSGGAHER